MLDNLQHWYLLRLERASEAALHGNIEECLSICFELRLKPDLALYTRALVNLTLADVCPIDLHPDKRKFAEEALRLGKELQEDMGPDKDAVWMTRLEQLVSDSTERLTAARTEEKSHRIGLKAQELDKFEDQMEGLELESPVKTQKSSSAVFDPEPDAKIVPWQLEGAITAKIPASSEAIRTKAKSLMELSEEEGELEDILPELPKSNVAAVGRRRGKQKRGALGLPTPHGSDV